MLTFLNSYVYIYRLSMRYPPVADNRGSSHEPEDEILRSLITWFRLLVSL